MVGSTCGICGIHQKIMAQKLVVAVELPREKYSLRALLRRGRKAHEAGSEPPKGGATTVMFQRDQCFLVAALRSHSL